jgi:3-hydroxyacyl-CoA dehydrogenase
MTSINNIAVIGEGKMGSSIFLYLNGFNYNLTWLCSGEKGMEEARRNFTRKTSHLLRSGILSETEYSLKVRNTNITASVNDLGDSDLVIEAVPESLSVKKELFRKIGNAVSKDCILVSNSSSILPTEMIPENVLADRSAGMHFFFPVPVKETVEVIANPATSVANIKLLADFLKEIKKTPFFQNESNPFVLNRIVLEVQAEAFIMIHENLFSLEAIDEIVTENLIPAGIFEFIDHVGIDTVFSSVGAYQRYSSDKERYSLMLKMLRDKVDQGHLGVKTGKGFFEYKGLTRQGDLHTKNIADEEEHRDIAISRLRKCFIVSCRDTIKSGVCTHAELTGFLQDYMGIDEEQFNRQFDSLQ